MKRTERTEGTAVSRITRRDVVGAMALAGAGLAATAWSGSGRLAGAGGRTVASGELEEATLRDLQRWLAAGRVTTGRLCELYLDRIRSLDGGGHGLSSILELNPEAQAIAERLDAERRAGGPVGPLHGIPVLIKDNIGTADRMETTAGSLALLGARPPRDAFVAQRLREAGAIILGKTNLSEWANFRSTHSSSGWSGRGGQCRNPYVLDRSPCGSSSGTGAAIAASLAAVGVGTETDGSVVCPSATCGLVGIKPTVGLVGRSGIVPLAHSQDTAGPMARTVADAAILLAAMMGPDPADRAAATAPFAAADLAAAATPGRLEGIRLGVPRKKLFGYSPEADRVIEDGLKALRELGATLVDPADIPHLGEYDDAEMEVLLYEFKADLETYLAGLGPDAPKRLANLIAFNERYRSREMPYFGQELFERAAAKGPLTEKGYLDAVAACRRLSRTEGLDAAFAKHRVDAFVAPTGSPAWPIDLINGDHFLGAASSPAAVSGYASLTVPAGAVFELPVGLTLIGRAWSEPALIRVAAAFEHAVRARRPPRFLPTVDFAAT